MAGVNPLVFDEMTVGEVVLMIEAHEERERQNLISRISAILRAFAKHGEAFKGLAKPGADNGPKKVSYREAARRWLWSSD